MITRINDSIFNELMAKGIRILLSTAEPEKSLTHFNKALKRAPKHAHAWYSKAVALHWSGKLKEALAAYDQAITLDPKMHQAYGNRNLCKESTIPIRMFSSH